MQLRVTLVQTNPRLGDLHANLEDHVAAVERAVAQGSELVLFPELSLTGYFVKDQVLELGLERDSETLARLAELSKGVSIAAGFVERARDGRLYNAYGFFEDGELLGVHRKVHLVSYGLFDEGRDFAAGDRFEVFESKLGRFGPLICEDAWHFGGAYLHFLDDVDAFLVPSASPARGVEAGHQGLGSQRTWDTLLMASATLFRTWVLYVGRVGWEDGIGFGGSTGVFDPFGRIDARLSGLDPGALEARLDRSTLLRARTETPLRRDEKPWVLAAGLVRHVPLLAERARLEEDGDAR